MGCKGLKRLQNVSQGSSMVACAHTVTWQAKDPRQQDGNKLIWHHLNSHVSFNCHIFLWHFVLSCRPQNVLA